jgi:hypothetical protein
MKKKTPRYEKKGNTNSLNIENWWYNILENRVHASKQVLPS